jgi:hypothetical protein
VVINFLKKKEKQIDEKLQAKVKQMFFLICILSGWYRHNPLIFQKSNNWLNQLKKLNGMGWFTFRLPDNKYVVFYYSIFMTIIT